MLGELVRGFGIIDQQTGGLHQAGPDLQARVIGIVLGDRAQRLVDLKPRAGIQASFAALADQRVRQAEVALRVLEARLRTLGYRLAIGARGGVEVFVGHRQLAQQGLSTYRQGGKANRLLQYALCRPGVALGHQHIGQSVVQPGHHREHLQRLFVQRLGLAGLTTLEQ
ncbi:hypothetical protein D3C73_1290310 [compost metagenome]